MAWMSPALDGLGVEELLEKKLRGCGAVDFKTTDIVLKTLHDIRCNLNKGRITAFMKSILG